MNSYERLGLPAQLAISDGEVHEAYARAGKREHPDAGGQEGTFAKLKDARDCLLSPSRRLAHWLEINGHQPELRGTVGPHLMDWFARVGALTQRAEELIRKRNDARSALTRALLEPETQALRDQVEELVSDIDLELQRLCEPFSELTELGESQHAWVDEILRHLTFLEKWRAGLRSAYGRLI